MLHGFLSSENLYLIQYFVLTGPQRPLSERVPYISVFGQKWLFGRKYVLPNLKRLFGQKWPFFVITVFFFSNESALSIERFGLLLMAESFQACYLKIL